MTYDAWLPDAFMLDGELFDDPIDESDPIDGIWTTADGRRIKISEMPDHHLVNILSMIDENGFANEDDWMKLFRDELTKRTAKIPNFNLEKKNG